MTARADFRVVAIVAAYNEADIVGQTVGDLVAQGVQVHFLDDGSTDGTIAAVEPYLGRGVLAIERLAATLPRKASDRFEWGRILARKAELARTIDADWFLHHDADEFRESPWPGVGLLDAIRRVDAMGYNAIDFAGFDFWPVDDRGHDGEDVRRAFPYCTPLAPHDRLQIRCWKKASDVDLASTGGHEARFDGRRVFPLRFILRHYPIRSRAHGVRKIARERRPRFLPEELARGWHVQYEERDEAGFIRDLSTLTLYDPDAVRLALTLHNRDVEALESVLGNVRAELETRVADLFRLHSDLSRLQGDLSRLQGDLARVQDDARRGREEREGLSREVERLRLSLEAAIEERRAESARLMAAIEDAVRRVRAIEASRSWRWTAPARAAWRLLRGW